MKTVISGAKYFKYPEAKLGDRLILKLENDNEFDKNAVGVYNSKGIKMGYIPGRDCIKLRSRYIEGITTASVFWVPEPIGIDIEFYDKKQL